MAHAEWLAITHGAHGGQGLQVACLCPGAVDTPMLRAEPAQRLAALTTGQEPVTSEVVADAVIRGLADERFLILTHPQAQDCEARKVADRDRWIRGMRRAWRAEAS